jgi:hypothetical protein
MPGLFGSTILEVVLGLSFVYFLLSLLCSSVNELLAGFLKLRAKDLEQAIRNLLCDEDLAREVLSHPLIKALGSTKSETIAVKVGAGQRSIWKRISGNWRDFAGKPSYIPSSSFTLALLDTITPPTGRAITVGDVQQAATELAGTAIKRVGDLTPKETIGRALLSLVNESRDPRQVFLTLDQLKDVVNTLPEPSLDAAAKANLTASSTLDELRRQIEKLPDGGARTKLVDLIAESQAGLDRAQQSIEQWFDDAMERASGIYKRRTQWWLLIIAALVTVFVGADTFRLYDSLATNPTLRTTVAEQAISAYGAFVTPTPGPVSEAMVTPAPDAAGEGTPSADSMAVIPPPPSAGEIFKELSETSLPFGYNDRPGIGPGDPDTDLGAWLRWLVRKIPGLVVTTFAVALGAPFWFDVLNRISNLRAAGKRPESTNTSARPSSAGPST